MSPVARHRREMIDSGIAAPPGAKRMSGSCVGRPHRMRQSAGVQLIPGRPSSVCPGRLTNHMRVNKLTYVNRLTQTEMGEYNGSEKESEA